MSGRGPGPSGDDRRDVGPQAARMPRAPEPKEDFMPLLMCPNDNGAMQTVNRSGVEFDICPTCRGVWLDRGELEKLLETARDGGVSAPQAQPTPKAAAYRDRDDHENDHDRWSNDDYRRKKRRGFDIFDIFD